MLRRFSHFNFDFETCFAPQPRALSEHRKFQKCSEAAVFYNFYFEICCAPLSRALFQHLNCESGSGRDVFLAF